MTWEVRVTDADAAVDRALPLRPTLGERLRGRSNALNFLRLVLASAVIVSHTWPLGGYGEDPFWGMTLGHWAVGGFFAVSGYLISQSRVSLGWRAFLWRRALRILPAFWVILVVTAFVLAPLSVLVTSGRWSPSSAWGYVLHNAALRITQPAIGTTLGFEAWNGSLWTLWYEFTAYLVTMLVLGSAFARRHAVSVSALAWLACTAASLWPGAVRRTLVALAGPGGDNFYRDWVREGLWLGAFYAAGMLVWALRGRLRRWGWLLAGSAPVLALAAVSGHAYALTPLPLAVAVLSLGALLPIRWCQTHDISYGVYIYAFPVQQLWAAAGLGAALPPWAFALVSWATTVVPAWLSWRYIERPALNLKGWVR